MPMLTVGSRAIEVKADLAQMQTAAPTSSSDSALFKAIMKVVQGRNISQLGIDINALRGSPQAKRALWPHLRQVMKF